MGLVVPDTREVDVLTDYLTPDLSLKLYGNDITPDGSSTESQFTEISGGGYAAKTLTFANWAIAAGDPSTAGYNSTQTFTFTGALNAPGGIYGYYVVDALTGELKWAERFPDANVPFIPQAGSIISLIPKFTCQSAF